MPPEPAPDAVRSLADARADARRAHDWDTADRLKAEIEAAGWKVVDAGTMYDLVRAGGATVVDGGVVRYGSSEAVPSRLGEPAIGVATIVMVVSAPVADAVRAIDAVVAHGPSGTGLVLVGDGLDATDEAALDAVAEDVTAAGDVPIEVVRTATRLGRAAARDAGIRRATAPLVIVLDSSLELRGDVVTPLVEALGDPSVAAAGAFGLVTEDLVRFEAAPPGQAAVEAIDGRLVAFRREDYAARGPLDERFGDDPYLDPWWSFVLRDLPDDASDDAEPRRALVVAGLPVAPASADPFQTPGDAAARIRPRKGLYRFLKQFATREDLLVERG